MCKAHSTDPQSQRKGNTQHQSYRQRILTLFLLAQANPISRSNQAAASDRRTKERKEYYNKNSTLVSSQQLSRSIAFSNTTDKGHHIHAQWVQRMQPKGRMEAKGAKERRMNDHTQYVRRNHLILVAPAVFSHNTAALLNLTSGPKMQPLREKDSEQARGTKAESNAGKGIVNRIERA